MSGRQTITFQEGKRTITGNELGKATLKSQGRMWEGMPIPKLKVTDLKREGQNDQEI